MRKIPYTNKEEGNANRREYYKNNREIMKERRLKDRRKKGRYVNDYKLSKGCYICGYNKCTEALDFHHNGDKKFDIGNARNSMGLGRLIEEMDKCKVLCRNCHAELHYKIRCTK